MSRSNTMKHRRTTRTHDNGYEGSAAAPKQKDRITPSDVWRTKVQSGPVKTWADMTPEQQKRILAQLKPSGTR